MKSHILSCSLTLIFGHTVPFCVLLVVLSLLLSDILHNTDSLLSLLLCCVMHHALIEQ